MARLVFWTPNYAPERTGIPPLVTDACAWLAGRGHDVTVVTALPNYPERRIQPGYAHTLRRVERRDGVRVVRTWLRVRPRESVVDKLLYETSFALSSLPDAVHAIRRADVVVGVQPTVFSAALAMHLPHRARRVLWVQDLVSAAADALAPGTLARSGLRTIEAVERSAARRADHVIVCSPGFVAQYDVPSIEVLLNWVDTEAIRATPQPGRTRLRVLYSGNLGYSQGFETAIDAARIAGDDVELRIVGEGNSAAHVRALAAGLANVTVEAPVAAEDYPGLLADADAQLVLQRRVSAGTNLPSKIGPYLASGRPVVASIAPHAPASALLEESGGALLVAPESPDELADAWRRLASETALRETLGTAGRAFAERRLAREHALPALESAFIG